MAKKSQFIKEFEQALTFFENNPEAFDIWRSALVIFQANGSVSKWRVLADIVRNWNEEFGFSVLFYLSRGDLDIPPSFRKRYPVAMSTLQQLKLLYGESLEDAWDAYDSPLGLKTVFNQFKRDKSLTSPVILERNDGQKLEFVFDGSDVGFLSEVSLEMLINFLNNGGELETHREEEIKRLVQAITEKFSPNNPPSAATEVASTAE